MLGVLIGWLTTSILALLLLRAPHAGMIIYLLFSACCWPFFYFGSYWTIATFVASVVVQLCYVLAVAAIVGVCFALRKILADRH